MKGWRELSRGTRLGVLVGLLAIVGVVIGVVASGGSTPHHPGAAAKDVGSASTTSTTAAKGAQGSSTSTSTPKSTTTSSTSSTSKASSTTQPHSTTSTTSPPTTTAPTAPPTTTTASGLAQTTVSWSEDTTNGQVHVVVVQKDGRSIPTGTVTIWGTDDPKNVSNSSPAPSSACHFTLAGGVGACAPGGGLPSMQDVVIRYSGDDFYLGFTFSDNGTYDYAS